MSLTLNLHVPNNENSLYTPASLSTDLVLSFSNIPLPYKLPYHNIFPFSPFLLFHSIVSAERNAHLAMVKFAGNDDDNKSGATLLNNPHCINLLTLYSYVSSTDPFHTDVYMCVCMYVCLYICMCVCMYLLALE